jgi:ribosomal protein S18 acetylase RimI-like enzyme
MIAIRDFVESDWHSVCRIHDAARPDELKGSCDPRAFVPLEQDPEAEELKESKIIVAQLEDEIVGFAAVRDSYLSFLYVHPDHYRQGIGLKLLRASIKLAEDVPWTIVLAENEPAISLYKRAGFDEVARFESDNEGYPVTCIRMVKEPASAV